MILGENVEYITDNSLHNLETSCRKQWYPKITVCLYSYTFIIPPVRVIMDVLVFVNYYVNHQIVLHHKKTMMLLSILKGRKFFVIEIKSMLQEYFLYREICKKKESDLHNELILNKVKNGSIGFDFRQNQLLIRLICSG